MSECHRREIDRVVIPAAHVFIQKGDLVRESPS